MNILSIINNQSKIYNIHILGNENQKLLLWELGIRMRHKMQDSRFKTKIFEPENLILEARDEKRETRSEGRKTRKTIIHS